MPHKFCGAVFSCIILSLGTYKNCCSGSLNLNQVSLRDLMQSNRGNPIKNRKIFYQRRKALQHIVSYKN
ncbi:MAG: hypothetical protein IJV35_00145 [Neisseriaceae bacterium]|nr:hypothetical protein [Neisseriaceae bacterium]